MLKTELAIVGAGPAGMSAAEAAIDCAMDVTVVDEQSAQGGQIYRQPPGDFKVSNWLNSRAYRGGKSLLSRVSAIPDVKWLFQSTVTGIIDPDYSRPEGNFTLVIEGKNGTRLLSAETVLIAPGCYDMPAIFPGWNIPGVMSAGGIQAFVKSQQFIPGNCFLFVGSHPLQLIVADQIVQAGGKVAGVVFAQSRKRVFDLVRAPVAVLQNLDKFALLAKALCRLMYARVPIIFNHTLVRANGEQTLRSAAIAPIDRNGTVRKEETTDIECDRLGVGFGFLASSELARQANADYTWNAARGGWIVSHDEWMRSSVPGIYVAGEITGVAGAEIAAREGRLAAIGCATALGKISLQQANDLALSSRRRLKKLRRFADLLSQVSWPGTRLLDQLVSDSANLCKCEEVTVGAFLKMMRQNPHVRTANSAKLLCRTGMGLCQGRYCHHAVTRLMARTLGLPEEAIGSFTSRFPAKPIEIHGLINSEERMR